MKSQPSRGGRHAAPNRPVVTARRIAAAAAALAAGAVPLADGAIAEAAADQAPPAATAPVSVAGVTRQALPALDPASNAVAGLVRDGAVGDVGRRVAPQAQTVTGSLADHAGPLTERLRGSGVPTVRDVADRLGHAHLPVAGDVGAVTRRLPVSAALGENPLAGALDNLTGL